MREAVYISDGFRMRTGSLGLLNALKTKLYFWPSFPRKENLGGGGLAAVVPWCHSGAAILCKHAKGRGHCLHVRCWQSGSLQARPIIVQSTDATRHSEALRPPRHTSQLAIKTPRTFYQTRALADVDRRLARGDLVDLSRSQPQ